MREISGFVGRPFVSASHYINLDWQPKTDICIEVAIIIDYSNL